MKKSFQFLLLFLISYPISVTLSQSFAILSTVFFVYHTYKEKKFTKDFFPIPFRLSILIYLSLLVSSVINFFNYESFFRTVSKSELSDFWMCFITIPAFHLYRIPEYRKKIHKAIYISFGIILFSGLISLFTPFRLGQFISNGFKVIDGDRLQHFAGDFGRFTYLPLGMMNTHLTFGGLLGICFTGIFIRFMNNFKQRKKLNNLVYILILFLFSILVFFNQSRSIWMGIIFVLGIYFYKLEKKDYKKFLFILLPIFFVIVGSIFFIYSKNWLIQRAFNESFKHSTENQRYFIYKNTLSMISENPFFGVGPGRFSTEHKKNSERMIRNFEQLWYELEITPRSHAHHDFLNFFAIGGIFSFFAYAFFWIYLFQKLFDSTRWSNSIFFWGLITIFIGGFFQCFILDDEVALPFFCYLGFFYSSCKSNQVNIGSDTFQVESLNMKNVILEFLKSNAKSISIVFIPLLVSILIIFILSLRAPEEVYHRKIKTNFPEDKVALRNSLRGNSFEMKTANMKDDTDQIKIEGCLTHYFGNPISIRKDPYRIRFKFAERTLNPPSFVKIFVYERDSFDQDKLYRVHQVRKLEEEFTVGLYPGDNILQIENIYSKLNSDKFPNNIYFRDFGFQFGGFDSSKDFFDFPSMSFGKNCNIE